MSKPIIEIKNISKKYTLGERQPYYSFRDTLSNIFQTPLRHQKTEKDEFWALKDVSLDINEGDVVGVIGRNGAGKSTLLKILSQITPPTEGEIKLRGRVASLLEVGTGFHPELTGRENVYLNGAILGMKRWEINKKFNEIIEFAEIEKFLDTPVKHYSSGMYMRLAFSVAAHLEPEILLVDEVLAVGDMQFQKKCLGKMSEVSRKGRTVIFVSHNIEAVKNLCQKVIYLDQGRIENYGITKDIIKRYISSTEKDTRRNLFDKHNVFIKKIEINGNRKVNTGGHLLIKIKYDSLKSDILKNCRIGLSFKSIYGNTLFICSTECVINKSINLANQGEISCYIDKLPLSAGKYLMDVFSEINGEIQDWFIDFSIIEVDGGKFFSGIRDVPTGLEGLSVLVPHKWIISDQK